MSTKSSRRKTRRLWLNIRASGVPRSVGVRGFWETLRRAVADKSYSVPDDWNVELDWKNKEGAEMRSGDFGAELTASAKSSNGFDKAVLDYIGRQIARASGPVVRKAKRKKRPAVKKRKRTRRAVAKKRKTRKRGKGKVRR
jgi:hypothetical protein